MSEVQVLEAPAKSENDKKEYRMIKLSNGLKAILIKEFIDESLEQSKEIAAASLAVNVGLFDDPKKAMGLAHFLEHILFMGSTKYPEENRFNDLLQANNGSDNAMTGSEATMFYFKIAEKAFPEALDMFAQQFISPLLLKSSMQREREAVDSEFRMASSNDAVIEESIYKTMIFESHPASQFECGNLNTLKEDISDDELHAELLKLHSKYVGNKMYLAVQSSRSLDDLQDLVLKSFLPIKKGEDNALKPLPSINDIFKPDFFDKVHHLKPRTAKKCLTLSWVLPSVQKMYKCSPVEYIEQIFANEGAGGLTSYLKDKHLITYVSFFYHSNAFSGNSQFCMPRLRVNLTDLGLQKIEKVLEAIFSYLLMIKETPIDDHQRLFNEFKEKTETVWKFSPTNVSAVQNVRSLMNPIMLYEDRDILRGSITFIEFNEETISWIIDSLNQGKFNILISDNDREVYTKKEKYFGAEYDEQNVPETYRKIWDERQLKPEFFLEKSNPFKATNFEIFVNEEESTKFPVKIHSDEIYEVWHKLDNKFKRPEALVSINFLSPKQMNSVHNYLYLRIYDEMISRFFKTKYAQAMSANLKVYSNADEKSFSLRFSGFNDKIESFVEMVAVDLKDFYNKMDLNIFDTFKLQLKKRYYNYLIDYEALNGEFVNEILYDSFFHDHELFNAVDSISFENLQKFVLKFFAKLKIHVLVQGNIRKSQALNVVKTLQENIICLPLDEDYNIRDRCYQLPLGTTVFRVKSSNQNDDNSQIRVYYQIGPETLRIKSLAKLIVSILDSKAFDYLRNKEQLGYSVGIRMQENSGVLGIRVHVSSQESKHSYNEVYAKIETFVSEIAKKTIDELTDEEFDQFKESRFKMLLADFSTLEEEMNYNWLEITSEEYVFDRYELAAKVTKALTKTELRNFFKSFTQPENIRKLSVQVIGHQGAEGQEAITDKSLKLEIMNEKLSEHENVITDLDEFHKQTVIYPLVKFEI